METTSWVTVLTAKWSLQAYPVLPLYPAASLVDADAGAVDRDGDGLVRLLEVAVGVDAEAEDPFADVSSRLLVAWLGPVCVVPL
jgi:hypothetical protein